MHEALLLVHPDKPVSRDAFLGELKRLSARRSPSPQISAYGSQGIEVRLPDFTLTINFSRSPHALEESREIAERYGAITEKKERIAACNSRFEIAGEDDPDMEYFNDFLHVVEAAQRVGEVYALDPGSGEFI